MKIFNRENESPVMYIQIKNLKAILSAEDKIPRQLIKKIQKLNIDNYSENQDEEFIRLEGRKIVTYLDELTWIPNYKNLRDLTEEEITEQIKILEQKVIDLSYIFNNMQPSEQRKSFHLINEHYKTNQKLKDLNAYLWTIQGKYDQLISIPLAVDTEQIHMRVLELGYIAGISLDKKKILFTKENGEKFTNKDGLPLPLIGNTIITLAIESGMITAPQGKVNINSYTEESNKFFVAECQIVKDSTKNKDNTQPNPTLTRIDQKKKVLTAYEQKK